MSKSKNTCGNMAINYQGLLPESETAIFVQYAQFHSYTSSVDCQITLLAQGDSIVQVGNIQHYMGMVGKDEWNLILPPFAIAVCAHWQAFVNNLPF